MSRLTTRFPLDDYFLILRWNHNLEIDEKRGCAKFKKKSDGKCTRNNKLENLWKLRDVLSTGLYNLKIHKNLGYVELVPEKPERNVYTNL